MAFGVAEPAALAASATTTAASAARTAIVIVIASAPAGAGGAALIPAFTGGPAMAFGIAIPAAAFMVGPFPTAT